MPSHLLEPPLRRRSLMYTHGYLEEKWTVVQKGKVVDAPKCASKHLLHICCFLQKEVLKKRRTEIKKEGFTLGFLCNSTKFAGMRAADTKLYTVVTQQLYLMRLSCSTLGEVMQCSRKLHTTGAAVYNNDTHARNYSVFSQVTCKNVSCLMSSGNPTTSETFWTILVSNHTCESWPQKSLYHI